MGYKLGLLDQSPIYDGETAFDALQHTIRLAQQAEEWGYSRFWVSEHHHAEQLAGSSPEVLISYLLAQTNSIRIGSGGVMLQHYSPFKVAENFHVLSSLAPLTSGSWDWKSARGVAALHKSAAIRNNK